MLPSGKLGENTGIDTAPRNKRGIRCSGHISWLMTTPGPSRFCKLGDAFGELTTANWLRRVFELKGGRSFEDKSEGANRNGERKAFP